MYSPIVNNVFLLSKINIDYPADYRGDETSSLLSRYGVSRYGVARRITAVTSLLIDINTDWKVLNMSYSIKSHKINIQNKRGVKVGTNTLTARVDNDLIPASDNNQFVDALVGEFVGRNNSRTPEDNFGQLGSSVFRWLRAYVSTYHIGSSANNLLIKEGAAGEIWIENPNGEKVVVADGTCSFFTDGVKRFEVTDTGINWNIIADSSIPNSKLAYNSNSAVGFHNQLANTGGVDVLLVSKNIVNIKQGKRIQVNYTGSNIPVFGSSPKIKIFINGGLVATGNGTISTIGSPVATTLPLSIYNVAIDYPVPSDGTYTVEIKYQFCTPTSGNYSIREA